MGKIAAKNEESRDQFFMEQALQEAQKAYKIREVPIGAVVVADGEIVGRGYNLREQKQDPTLHAEMIALKEAANFFSSWRLDQCTLYVTLEPCSMCAGAVLQARIARLVFAAFDKKAGACGSLYNLLSDDRLNHQVPTESGVLAEKSSKLLKDFFAELRADG